MLKKLDFSQNIGSEMLCYIQIYAQNRRETQQRGKRNQNQRILSLETSIYHMICSHFQEISENFRYIFFDDLKFYLANPPDIFERKDTGFVRFIYGSDDPENLSKKY